MKTSLGNAFQKLKTYCENENYQGWDPYDGLNSKIFQSTPFKHSSFARLAWIQLFKRNPVNLRKLFLVSKGHNPKALGLFLTGYCNLYELAQEGNEQFGSTEEIREKIQYLADLLIELQTPGYSGACWGYNFDWQARGGLFFPAFTPTVVATTYAVNGLLDANQILQDKKLEEAAVSSAEFILQDLNRTQKKEGFLFSYAPKFGNNTVYNASLLGSRLLARIYSLTKNKEYAEAARQSVLACCNAQNEDGSWYYGELDIQDWIDSFHTGFNLDAIYDYKQYTGDESFQENYEKGFRYYIQHFFLDDGTPKYYHDTTYPIDIHCPAQFITTLSKTNRFQQHETLAEKVINWTIQNMQNAKGYFYYQKKKSHTNKIPYMRWSQAWMFAAMSYYLKEIQD
ncbi:delta-aminolevulinic acid dehydratase [Rhodohalobacter mucosus]|uniref:Delta-aminolevulinic acid dehydratase n=1 Tax=Rhodohalobacter mucosus TaxID=2079485 RepID=A0A316TUF4_9BACT|nr:delta-aminolevulinic acid dehydratase [Rhodohalobacter mucosus]PWN07468.1 delta-aminolevulinic acid dehydratase [Rhodohalobacter mucosus]